MEFKDRIVVVTGAASGIGLALARRFVAEGSKVVLADIQDAPALDDARGGRARFVHADIATDEGVGALVDDVLAREGRIDLFVSNAGMSLAMDATASEEDWARIIAVNQMSHVRAARRLVPVMLAQGGGHILITASAASLLNSLTSIGYATTKYATLGFAEWLAFAYRGQGVGVSVLCPGAVQTPLIRGIAYLQQDVITPEEVAEATLAGLAADRFMITTHASTMGYFRQKAADYEAYIGFLVGYREQALAMQPPRPGDA